MEHLIFAAGVLIGALAGYDIAVRKDRKPGESGAAEVFAPMQEISEEWENMMQYAGYPREKKEETDDEGSGGL